MSAGLLEHFERLAEAPGAIPRLRRLVLDLAVRGKLVAQDSANESISPSKCLTTSGAFPTPANWRWIRIGDQLELLNGIAFKPTDWKSSGLRIARIQNLNNPEAPFNHCDPEIARQRSLIDTGSFLISWSGTPGTSFGAFIWNRGPAVLNQHIFRCDFKTDHFTSEFLRLAINSRLDEMIAKAHGGVGLQHITKGKLEALLIPLPPLAEQHRIVAKVDELMGLLDRIEAAQATREATRQQLATASIARLSSATDDADFQTSADFLLQTLPTHTTRREQIKQLRQTILNLAVRGRLVPQDLTEVPAIETTKAKSSEWPFNLPSNWRWTQLADLCSKTGSGSTPRGGKEVYKDSGIPFLRSQNIHNDALKLDDVAYIDFETHQRMSGTKVEPGDLLLNITGGSIGRCAIVPATQQEANISQHVAIIRAKNGEMKQFMHKAILSPFFQSYIFDEQTGAGRGGLPKNRMDRIPMPIPPLAEQHRIVAKVDELMALCDRLDTALAQAEAARARLLDAEVFSATETREVGLMG